MIEIGNPAYIKYDPDLGIASTKMVKPSDPNKTILDKIREHLKGVKNAHVCLSGGVDSQFWLRVLEHFNINYRATTYLTTWDGAPINTDDYVCAELVAKKFNLGERWNVIEIDLKKFLNSNRPFELAKKYKTASQQIALHCHFLEKIVNPNETFFMGGDGIFLMEGNDDDACLGVQLSNLQDLLTYKNLFNLHNVKYFKDVWYLDREMPYLGFMLNIDITKKYKTHLSKKVQPTNPDTLEIKHLMWEEILPGTVNTLIKITGFERIKKHLAMESGIYNQFDILYRKPLQDYMATDKTIMFNYNTEENPSNLKKDIQYKDVLLRQEITKQFLSTIKEVDSKPVEKYLFDF